MVRSRICIKSQMYRGLLILSFVIGYAVNGSQLSLKEWFTKYLANVQADGPTVFVFGYITDDKIPLSEDAIIEDIETAEELESTNVIGNPVRVTRHVSQGSYDARLLDRHNNNNNNYTGDMHFGANNNMNLKANLRYHHEQRHPNGSVSGSFGRTDPNGSMKTVHYIKDDKGYREFPENSQITTNGVQQQTQQQIAPGNSNNGQNGHSINLSNRRGIFYPPLDAQNQSPILQSAVGSVQTYAERSPLYEKYYRPSPEEVQQAYEYHRLRSQQDPNVYRPQDATPLPDLPPTPLKEPQVQAVYGEYRPPITTIRYNEPPGGGGNPYYTYSSSSAPSPVDQVRYYDLPQYATPSPVPLYTQPSLPSAAPEAIYNLPAVEATRPYQQPQYYATYYDPSGAVYFQNPYPQSMPPQSPVYVQTNTDQPFSPASTYSGPYAPNTATFNQPYPNNVPIYRTQPVPQNIPTYVQAPPDNVPVYQHVPNSAIPVGLPNNVLAYAGVNPNQLINS